MLKGIIGFLTMFFVILPFLLINIKIIKIKNNDKFVRVFFILLILMILAAALVCVNLYPIGGNILIGGLIAFAIYIVLIIIQFFLHANYVKEEYVDIDDDSFENEINTYNDLENIETYSNLTLKPEEEYEIFKKYNLSE